MNLKRWLELSEKLDNALESTYLALIEKEKKNILSSDEKLQLTQIRKKMKWENDNPGKTVASGADKRLPPGAKTTLSPQEREAAKKRLGL